MKRGILGIFLAMVLGPSIHGEITLTDNQQHQATVEITEATADTISFSAKGQKGAIKLDQLTEASRAAAIAYAKDKNVYQSFPAFTVQVKVAYQHRNSGDVWYEKDVKITPSIVIEGGKKMKGLPAAEACLVIVTHDTRQKYVFHVEKMKICSTETISIPGAEKGDRREFPFQAIPVTFDTARDTSNVGGDEYKYFIFALRDAATRQIVDFQSNSPQVMSYVARHPEARETLLAARKGEPFTDDFPAQ
ncbi:MAG TPA: hypothetical protein VNB29_10360 [Chthoniobacterales bacterium]|nr:hypothetical protein [Chthoniobacterales bacterium]